MTVCSGSELEFPGCKNRKVQANFNGGNITSGGGVLLLTQADKQIGSVAKKYFRYKDIVSA